MFHSLSEPEILNRLDWDDYKRNVVSNLIDYLASNQEKYKDVLLFNVRYSKMKDFSHLARLEDGKEKVKVAIESVKALEKLYKSHDSLVIEQKRIVERRMMAQVQRKQKQAVNEKINELNNKYLKLLTSVDAHSRGYELETIVKQLFVLYDLDPKSSFRVQGEQIDGAFTFDNTDYLLKRNGERN